MTYAQTLFGFAAAIVTTAIIVPLAFWSRRALKPAAQHKLVVALFFLAFSASAAALFITDERIVVPITMMVIMSMLVGNTNTEKTREELIALKERQAALEETIRTLKRG